MVAETSYVNTFEDGDGHPNTVSESEPVLAYEASVQGQAEHVRNVFQAVSNVGDAGLGVFYWEPAWIPVARSGWATEASLKYMQDKGPCGNEWANQALFDYDGNVLPTLEVIRDDKEK